MPQFIRVHDSPCSVFPLGHLAFAYLWYVAYAALTRRPLPARWALVPMAIGSQFPDLIDKPLAYYGVLASGRSVAHSLLITVLIAGLVTWGAHVLHRWRPAHRWVGRLCVVTPAAFSIGYLSHLVGDSLGPLRAGAYDSLTYLGWPLLAAPRYAGDSVAPWIRILELYRQSGTHPERPLIVTALLVFISLRVWARFGPPRPADG
ncbi:metal-dependent hydrolase [Natrinema gelatinilyticum]|uniref:metal-dependent hydrolase n=1 Tax=Natrinema gelatinilyticum TaxID=2961571 RepID=UPI0020C557FB|nr:metal-dependent hydrolase [Natrinema gelatinilyticum]